MTYMQGWTVSIKRQIPTGESDVREVFTTEGNFDRHLMPGRTADDFDGSWCQPPAAAGLIQHGGGWWAQPGPNRAAWEGRSNSDRESQRAAEAPDGPGEGDAA